MNKPEDIEDLQPEEQDTGQVKGGLTQEGGPPIPRPGPGQPNPGPRARS